MVEGSNVCLNANDRSIIVKRVMYTSICVGVWWYVLYHCTVCMLFSVQFYVNYRIGLDVCAYYVYVAWLMVNGQTIVLHM